MTAFVNRIFIIFFAILLLTGVALAAYLQEEYYLLIPLGVLLAFLLLQKPEYLFYLLVLSIPWSIEFNFTPSLGTDLPDEPLMLLTALAIIMLIIFRRKEMTAWRRPHALVILLALQFLWILITVITSTDFLLSLKYVIAKSWYLLAFVAAPAYLFRDEKILKRSALLLMCSMLLFMFVTLVRHSQNGWTFEKINDSLQPFYRNHVNYSALLTFMVPLQLAVIRYTGSRWLKFIMSCTLSITLGALYFSYARGAWLALITGLAAYWLIHKRLLFFSYLLFFVLIIAGVLWIKSGDRYLKFTNDYKTTIFHSDFSEHLIATYELKDMSNAERVYRWVAGVRMIPDSWKTGLGPNTFYHQYKPYIVPAFKTYVSENKEQSTVHNYFLLMIIEQGVIGMAFFAILLAALFWYAEKIYHSTQDKFWKIAMAAVASIVMMELTVNFLSDMIETDKIGSVLFLCVAVIIVASKKTYRTT